MLEKHSHSKIDMMAQYSCVHYMAKGLQHYTLKTKPWALTALNAAGISFNHMSISEDGQVIRSVSQLGFQFIKGVEIG